MHDTIHHIVSCLLFFFFFSSRRRHTRYIGDWSSDVCSSDLSAYSQLVDSFAATTQGEAAVRGVKPSGTEYALAIRLTGKFKTAFPEGRPTPEDRGDKNVAKAPEKKAAKADAKAEAAPLKESAADNAVVLVGDSDFINDGAAVQIQEIFGQRIVIPRHGNLAFAQALVDQVAGAPAPSTLSRA